MPPHRGAIVDPAEIQTNSYLQKREQSIRAVVGYMSEEFTCSHNNYRGSLFVGSEGVLFEGFLFFFQQRVVALKWNRVVRIDKTEHAITIVATKEDEESYEFNSIHNTERVWSTLISLYHETLTGTPRASHKKTLSRVPLRRTLTDPLPEMPQHDTTDEGSITEQDYAAACAVANMQTSSNHSSIFRSRSLPPSRSSDMDDNGPPLEDDVSMTEEEEWEQVLTESETCFSVCVVKNLELTSNLDALVDTFLCDNANESIPSYMQQMGDENIVVSTWRPHKDGQSQSRTIEYSHPVNAPLAPPMARAKKEQRYRRYGDHGLVVTTETHVQDVPMTDCFFVMDQILVEPKAPKDNSDEQVLLLTTVFDIRFVKSTMFRSIIANTTRGEFQTWFEGLADHMCVSLGGRVPVKPTEAPPAPLSTMMLTLVTCLALALLVLVLLLQLYIMFQIQRLQSSVVNLQ